MSGKFTRFAALQFANDLTIITVLDELNSISSATDDLSTASIEESQSNVGSSDVAAADGMWQSILLNVGGIWNLGIASARSINVLLENLLTTVQGLQSSMEVLVKNTMPKDDGSENGGLSVSVHHK